MGRLTSTHSTSQNFPITFPSRTGPSMRSPGSQSLTLPGSTALPPEIQIWPSTSFDYKYNRTDMGGTFDLTMIKPFFITVDANRVKREGQMPWGAPAPGSQLHSNTTEFPLPIDDNTTNVNGTFGWKSKQYYAGNDRRIQQLFQQRREHPYSRCRPLSGFPTNMIPGAPDNKSYYVKFTGTAKLPLSSTFALTGSFNENTSETNLINSSN